MNDPVRPVISALTGAALAERCAQIRAQIGHAFVGQGEVLDQLLIALLAGGHVLIEGAPGLGKTLLVRALAAALDCSYARVQFTPDLMPSDVSGHAFYDPKSASFRIRRGPVFANLLLADEINRAPAKTQAALLEAMQELQVTIESRSFALEPPFVAIATQNPIEQEGTYPLPEAQLDRFMFKVNVRFPSLDDLVSILDRTTGVEVPEASKVADGAQVLEMGRLALNTPVASHVSEYVARLVLNTHPDTSGAPPLVKQFVRYGASPRGAQSLILGAKCNALLEGRFNVSFEDVAAVAPGALRHRLLMNFEGLAEGIAADAVIADVLRATPKTR